MTMLEYRNLLIKSATNGVFPSNGPAYCLYRGENGKRCAAGLLIPDEKYQSRFEGNSVEDIIRKEGLDNIPFELPEGMTLKQLEVCQQLHDYYDVNNLEWNAADFIHKVKEQFLNWGVDE